MRNFLILFNFVYVAVLSGKCDDIQGYTLNKASGRAYKLMYKAENWQTAKEVCESNGARLAVPKSKDEFIFLQQRVVRPMYFPDVVGAEYKLLVWLGINNLENYKVWKNIDGENIDDSGFHDWSEGNGPNGDPRPEPREPHCVGMDAHNPGLRHWWCHLAQPYICEKEI